MLLIIIKIIIVLLIIWFGFLTLVRGIQYLGWDGSEDPHEVSFPNIKFVFPLKDFVIDFFVTILLIVLFIFL